MVEKVKETCMKKFGVSNAGQSEEIKSKIRETYEKNYGMHPLKTDEVKSKREKTCLEKYGGHPNQNKEVQIKAEVNSFAYKEYVLPSGKKVKYQGYENMALDELVKLYKEADISIGRSNIPSITYYIDEKKHVYFPDFFIQKENKIIEVKSEWTIQLRRGNIEEKAQATRKAGYAYEIWVYNDKKIKVETKVY
jgi:predicted nuclease of restriction endonuclease-like RecB superfamily